MAVKSREHLGKILDKLENESEDKYLVFSSPNPKYKDFLLENGFKFSNDVWSRVMIKDLEGELNISELFDGKSHLGTYEYF